MPGTFYFLIHSLPTVHEVLKNYYSHFTDEELGFGVVEELA